MVTYNQHWTPSETDFNTLKWLLERLTTAEDFCRPYFDRAKRHYRLWRFGSAVNEDDWPYVNRVRSRDILAFTEDSTALLIQTLFAQMPFFAVEPRETRMLYMNYEGIDPMLIGDQLSRCLDYQICHEDTEFFDEMIDCFKGGIIFGNGYEGVYPKFDAEGRYLRPLLKTTDYWDILPIPGGRRITKSLGVFVRDFTTLEQLQREAQQGFYKNVEYIRGPEGEANADIEWHRNLLQEVGMEDYVPGDIGNIELLHYFSGGHVITFANRKVILRNSNERAQGEEGSYEAKMFKPYPYDMPIVQYKYMPVPLEFFAMGIPEVLEVLQEDKNLIRSARRDNIDLVIQTILKARSGADINFDLIKFYPGAIWPLENLNDIQEMEIKDVTQNAYQEEAMRTQDMENALSLFGYARGMTPLHSEQPTTVIRLQQASLNRLDLNVKLTEFGFLQNIATRIILLTRRFMSQADYEAIIGDQDAGFYRLTEEDIRRFYHFRPVGSSVTRLKEIRQQQIQAAMNMTMGVPPQVMAANVEPFTVNYYELLRTAYDAIDIKNVDRILVKLQPTHAPPNPAEGVGNPSEMQALANVMYGEGGGLHDMMNQITKSATTPPKPPGRGE